jgi:cell division protein ZapA
MTAEASHEHPATKQVTVAINNRNYRLACEEGQEAHLRQLARDLDERIAGLRARFGEIGDARLIVMAALMEADELLEARQKIQWLEDELSTLQSARATAATRQQETQTAIVAAFNAAAERIEGMATKLNQAPGGSPIASETT